MEELKLGSVEGRFAEIIWQNDGRNEHKTDLVHIINHPVQSGKNRGRGCENEKGCGTYRNIYAFLRGEHTNVYDSACLGDSVY